MGLSDLQSTAKHFHRSERQFRDDVRELSIPHIKIGRKALFDIPRVELFLESVEVKKTPARQSRRGVKAVNKYAEALGL